MNIQISVVVWTVICFLLLMLILKNLLFKPVLRMLDNRKEKIEGAREKRAEIERITAENEEYIQKQREFDIEVHEKEAKEQAQKIQSEGKKEIEAAQRKSLDEIKAYRESIIDEYEDIVKSVAPEMETAAAIFAKNIIMHRV